MPPFAGHHTHGIGSYKARGQGLHHRGQIPDDKDKKPHLYGMVINQGHAEKIRIFAGPNNQTPDPTINELTTLSNDVLASSGLYLKVLIWGARNEPSVQWSGSALAFEKQEPSDRAIANKLINEKALQVAAEEPRSPFDVVNYNKITLQTSQTR